MNNPWIKYGPPIVVVSIIIYLVFKYRQTIVESTVNSIDRLLSYLFIAATVYGLWVLENQWRAALVMTVFLSIVIGCKLAGSLKIFAYKPQSGFIVARSRSTAFERFIIQPKDKLRMLAMADAEILEIDKFFDGTDEQKMLKTNTKAKVLKWIDYLNDSSKVEECSGLLYALTGYCWLSWNPFVGLIKSDLGNGPYQVQIIRSPDMTVTGVDIPGKGGEGTIKVTVKTEAQNVAIFDWDRMFFTEESTDNQVLGRLDAATKITCRATDTDGIRKKKFPKEDRQEAAADLIDFGLIPGTNLTIYDLILTGSEAEFIVAERAIAQEKVALAETQKQEALIVADKDAAVTVKRAEAERKRKELEGQGEAAALQAKLKAMEKSSPDVQRAVLGTTSAGQLPVGVTTVSLGGDQVSGTVAVTQAGKKQTDK